MQPNKTSFTGSIASSAKCRYISYSEADFEFFFAAQVQHVAPIGLAEIWHGGVNRSAKFHPHRCNSKGIGAPKLKFLLRFYPNWNYKRPAEVYPLRDFQEM